MYRMIRLLGCLTAIVILFAFPRPATALLGPDDLALIVNENVPESRRLAEYYAQLRGVPDGRIISLKLPPADALSFEQYEQDVFSPVRRFLLDHHLESKIKCLVTFYGVPLRISAHQLTRDEQLEVNQLRDLTVQVRPQIDELVEKLEAIAQQLQSTFMPQRRSDMRSLELRASHALEIIGTHLAAVHDPAQRDELYKQVLQVLQGLGGPAAIVQQEARMLQNPGAPEEQKQLVNQKIAELSAIQRQLIDLQNDRANPASREKNRELVKRYFGLLTYAQLLEGQLNYFNPEQTVAALDSELALLWLPYYQRANWITNPLYFELIAQPRQPALMVSRLDAPQAGEVTQLLLASRKAEQQGLRGRVAIDARGIAPVNAEGKPDGYGQFDQTLRNLAEIIQKKTKLPLTFDDQPAVFPPNSIKDVAIYVGWYSLQHYVPAFTFVPGAVGYHIASFEMTTLRDPEKNQWVKGLLNDGIAATLGPVDEPYTLAFPRPDKFFPLLFTGKLTLAEVYWRTQPTASWRVALIGDPLYNPFAHDPAIAVSDLSDDLRAVIRTDSPSTQPAGTQVPTPNGR